ncbi:MAG TPA: hypothetical protein VD926_05100 [Acidimicrobiales bacterium]|nr:hypothetical protein [Acidimicrobiales bacterium]
MATTRRLVLLVAAAATGPSVVALVAWRLDGPTYAGVARPEPGDVVVRWQVGWIQQGDGPAEVCWTVTASDPPQCGGGPTVHGLDLATIPESELDPFGNAPGLRIVHDVEVELELAVASDGSFHHVDHTAGVDDAPEQEPVACPVPDDPVDPIDAYHELTADEPSVYDGLGDNVLSAGAGDDLGFDVVYVTPEVVAELCGLTDAVTTITPEGVVIS